MTVSIHSRVCLLVVHGDDESVFPTWIWPHVGQRQLQDVDGTSMHIRLGKRRRGRGRRGGGGKEEGRGGGGGIGKVGGGGVFTVSGRVTLCSVCVAYKDKQLTSLFS